MCRKTDCPSLICGIASAKATFCQEMLAVIFLINRSIDSYLWDMSHIKPSHRLGVNFSHPNGIILPHCYIAFSHTYFDPEGIITLKQGGTASKVAC